MSQSMQNCLFVFIIPFVVGLPVRLVIRKTRNPFILSVCMIALAVIMWIVYAVVPNHGSEGYGILALIATSLALGALVSGLITRIRYSKK